MSHDSKPHRKIFLKNMAVELSIGIHDFEKLAKQNVLVNVTLDLDPHVRVSHDSISETVDYDFLRNMIIELASTQHFHLQETFCEKILALCLRQDGVYAAKVSSQKTDVYPDCESVGFEIFETKS